MKTSLDPTTQKLSVKRTCPLCGKVQVIIVDAEPYSKWRRGELMIQHALPDLTPDQREILLSGICPECWDKAFGEE